MEGSYLFKAVAALSILLRFTTYLNSCSAAGATPGETNTEFIQKSCHVTTYPRLCISSLSSYASKIQSSPKLLADTALSISLETALSTSTTITKLSKIHGLQPAEAAAISDCVEQIRDSVDELQRSLQEMEHPGGSNFVLPNDVQTWVSAALTDDDTCMDGFAEIASKGKVHAMVRSRILHVAQMTSNALSLINNYASTRTTLS
ncbi:hypothetical protein PVL29_002004 [Vitis rotundifolia]|uniref:Pectinesterase inhibitor domain-containing protein n=1 Tax=Vitis rotundifolia TaxID=103349 RepID=A0AA39AI43_VITRO|nr:hypothetical protein PVL29_002004 [Vitis rotundifolia]